MSHNMTPSLPKLRLYSIFHLNLAYSSIEEEQRPIVIEKCYWPMLRLIEQSRQRFGIEASAYTLEVISRIDPTWICHLRYLAQQKLIEFIGCGYAQIIGPLVPAQVNRWNLALGNEMYQQHLGAKPVVALVNEQAFSSGLISHYLDAGYKALVMEWNNPVAHHPDWQNEWRYYPQFVTDQHGNRIQVLWSDSISFQQFQRYAHRQISCGEYLSYLKKHTLKSGERVLSLYCNDAEIFDFRPGRYNTEAFLDNAESEWVNIANLFALIAADPSLSLILPSETLRTQNFEYGGNVLQLESATLPIPVKKQGKYNVLRWALSGRDDLAKNTSCQRIYDRLVEQNIVEPYYWRKLCYFWSSDFRTHITEKRWNKYLAELAEFEGTLGIRKRIKEYGLVNTTLPAAQSREVTTETPTLHLRLDTHRGLSIKALCFKQINDLPSILTVPHGYFDDIALSADWYSGHLVFEQGGTQKITDLHKVGLSHISDESSTRFHVAQSLPLGAIGKDIVVHHDKPRVDITYSIVRTQASIGTLRLGFVTLNPEVFERESLFYACRNGGTKLEVFQITSPVDHGKSISQLVSATTALGCTDGRLFIGDKHQVIEIRFDRAQACAIPMIYFQPSKVGYLFRVCFSLQETDDTTKITTEVPSDLQFTLSIEPSEILFSHKVHTE